MRNITVDDQDQATLEYFPPACNGSGWTVDDSQGYQGSYRSCSGWEGSFRPQVALRFTGVAVYYYISPNFDGGSIQFILDGVPSGAVNPARPSSREPSSWPSSWMLWGHTGLENTEHTLRVIPGDDSHRLDVDAFIYTVPDLNSTISQQNEQPFLSLRTLYARAEPSGAATNVPTILGSVFGGIVFFIFLGIAYHLRKQTKERSAQYTWKAPVPPLSRTPDPDGVLDEITSHSNLRSDGNHESSAAHHTSSRDMTRSPTFPPPEDRVVPVSHSSSPRPLPKTPSRNNSHSTSFPELDYERASTSIPSRSYHLPSVRDAASSYYPLTHAGEHVHNTPSQRAASSSTRVAAQTPIIKLEPNRRKTAD